MKSFFALAALAVMAFAAPTIDTVSVADIQGSDDNGAALAASFELSLQDLFKKAQANDERKAAEAEAAELQKLVDADKEEKAKVADKTKEGKDFGGLSNVYDVADWSVSTGGVKRGDLSIKTAWSLSTGVDASTTLMLWWSMDPTAEYDPATAKYQIMTAASMYSPSFETSQFTRAVFGANTAQFYNYSISSRSISAAYSEAVTAAGGDEDAVTNILNTAEQNDLNSNRFVFTLDAEGKFGAQEKMKQAKYWALDAANTSYDATNGAQTVTMMRTNAGQADIKVGGAAASGFIFTDANGG